MGVTSFFFPSFFPLSFLHPPFRWFGSALLLFAVLRYLCLSDCFSGFKKQCQNKAYIKDKILIFSKLFSKK